MKQQKAVDMQSALNSDYAEAHNNLGTVLQEEGKFNEAVTCYRQTIKLKPDHAMAHCNLGTTLQELGEYEEAVLYCRQAISLNPKLANLHNNLGAILQKQERLEEALSSYDTAIKLNPDYAEAHMNRSFALLLTGNYKEGWPEYEWRLKTKAHRLRDFHKPVWDGSPLNGKSILVHAEQGFGDTIQFVRYLPMVQAQGGNVIFECRQNLIRLLKNCTGINKIIERTPTPSVQYDTHIPILSLPGIFGTTLDSIPSDIPYITIDPGLIEQWRMRFDHNKDFKVGIVWAGNLHNKKNHIRSCNLTNFAPLLETPGTSFYSLQKGPASAEVNNLPKGLEIITLDTELNDFADTAAAIANLDLVISVDTAVAHLAGAIGKPIWTLLHFSTDWRWLMDREDSPWYPRPNGLAGRAGMRLFRQTKHNDWTNVFEKVKQRLLNIMED